MKTFDSDVAALREALARSKSTASRAKTAAVVSESLRDLTLAIDAGGDVIRLSGDAIEGLDAVFEIGTGGLTIGKADLEKFVLVIGTGGGVIGTPPKPHRAGAGSAFEDAVADEIVVFEKNCPNCGTKVPFP